jgi:hypothetical protein
MKTAFTLLMGLAAGSLAGANQSGVVMPSQAQAPAPAQQKKATSPADPITGHVARFMAPFEVVDRSGRPILRVLDFSTFSGGAYVFNPAGNISAIVGPSPGDGGGRFVANAGQSVPTSSP